MILSKIFFVGFIFFFYFNIGYIDLVNYIICFGVKIDNKLIWFVYIDLVKKFFMQKVGVLKRMRIFLKKVFEEIYFKIIIFSVMYGILVWGNCFFFVLNFLNYIYVRVVCIVNNFDLMMVDDICFMKFDWLFIFYFYKKFVLFFLYKVYFGIMI